jgi:hypothetical protein
MEVIKMFDGLFLAIALILGLGFIFLLIYGLITGHPLDLRSKDRDMSKDRERVYIEIDDDMITVDGERFRNNYDEGKYLMGKYDISVFDIDEKLNGFYYVIEEKSSKDDDVDDEVITRQDIVETKVGFITRKAIILVLVVLALFGAGMFISMRRSHMMGAGSQGSAGGLMAVSASGTPIRAPAAAGNLPKNTAMQAAGDLLVSLNISPYPPSSGGASDFVVNLSDANGQPISDATISLDLTMPEMWMPANLLNLAAADPGKYQASGYFTMRGLWRIEVIITRGDQKQSVFFDIGL